MQQTMTRLVVIAAGLMTLAAGFPQTARAQLYKGKTITMIVNYPAGGPTDIEARIVAQHLPQHIAGQPTIVVKNVGGGSGLLGSNELGDAATDGMTMMVVTHEMGFARRVATRVIFMDMGEVVEDCSTDAFFSHPQSRSDRAQLFLDKILSH